MKVGIFTFHWATNYGAILQAYCLQTFLSAIGHDVSIINYKPKKYDFSWLNFLKHPGLFKTLDRQLSNRKKDELLERFRKSNLNMTKRYFSINDFGTDINDYDILISGSDQVLNPNFTKDGENGNVSPVYWLQCGKNGTKRIGYAVSFGCECYPSDIIQVVSHWVNKFNIIGVRETTGLQILDQIGYKGCKTILPDPTLLLGIDIFKKLGIKIPIRKENYCCVYMIRHEIRISGDVKYIDDRHPPLTMEQWLQTIVTAKQIITNSYHGMIIAMLSHVPFAILLESGNGSGMNDRFITLLSRFGITDRLVMSADEAICVLQRQIDFSKIDDILSEFGREGKSFLKNNISVTHVM